MSLSDLKDIVIILGVVVNVVSVVIALLTYKRNVRSAVRQRSIENAMRYWDIHNRLFEPNGFIMSNVKEIEAGTFLRNLSDKKMETKFNELLGACEHIALIQNAGGVPSSINAYMIGWHAKRIYPMLTAEEKANKFWELAVDFLETTKIEADRLEQMTREERLAYLKKNHFA